MHDSVFDFLRNGLSKDEVEGKVVLEVGSRFVNGSARQVVVALKPSVYIGTDLMDGKGVDVVLPAEKLSSRFSDIDVVICVEVLEHVEFWQAAIREMKKVLRPGGILLLTTRSPGFPYHPHPGDFWRFTQSDLAHIFRDFFVVNLFNDPQHDHPGVFLKAIRPQHQDFIPVDVSAFYVKSVG